MSIGSFTTSATRHLTTIAHQPAIDFFRVIDQAAAMSDEVGISALSGRRIDSRLLASSPASGRIAGRDEMSRCAQTGLMFFPDEVEQCCQTGEIYDKRLLATSHSGRRGLHRLLRRCALTGEPAFEDELGTCEVTGRSVLKNRLKTCAMTGKVVAEDRLAPSPTSGRVVLKDMLMKTKPNGVRCAKDEAVICPWGGYETAEAEMFTCQYSGARFSPEFRGEEGHLKSFEDMLQNYGIGEGGATLSDWLAKQGRGAFRGLTRIRYMRAPSRNLYAVVCEMTQSFGLRRNVGALLFKADGSKKRIVGSATILRIFQDRAEVMKQIDFGGLGEFG